MDRKTSKQLLRLLHGELSGDAAHQLQERLRHDQGLRREFETLRRLWNELDLPEPKPAPPGFADRVVARATGAADSGAAPIWWVGTLAGRATTALILAAGTALGALLAAPGETQDWGDYLGSEPSMVESYLLAMEQTGDGNWLEDGS